MATLNIKQFPDRLYRQLQACAKREHRSVAQQVVVLLERAVADNRHSIFELEGVGEAMWRGLGRDAAAYIRQERDAWD